MANEVNFDQFLKGERLYGEGLSQQEVEAWYRNEKFAYCNLGAGDRQSYNYSYHALNWRHGFSHLPNRPFTNVLGFGSAYGDELLPVAHRARNITILEPCPAFRVREVGGVPVTYVEPAPDGSLPFADDTFDLATCFSVIHHLPNVEHLIHELYRCLASGGFLLLREPIISMGDWRKPRKGVTRSERGIPFKIFREMVHKAGFRVLREQKCTFSLTSRLNYLLPVPVYNVKWCVLLDEWICRLPIWSERYHPNNYFQKLRPWSVAFVLQKPEREMVEP
jgi:SAM-dependent methyltransferase